MSGTKIQAAERPIGDIFSDEYRFTIPRYQRPYAWTTEQAGEMFDDLLAAASDGVFTTKNGVSPFVLTTQVLAEQQWTPELLGRRQDDLAAALATLWKLA